jgi:predicted ATP-dependent protease
LDPEVSRYFKVLVDFDDELDRSPSGETTIARLIAALIRRHEFLPFDRRAVGRVIEHAARIAEDSKKLTLQVEKIHDLIAEADFLARRETQAVVSALYIDQAIEQQIRRAARLQERSQEAILREIALIDTEGLCVGQINGLSVISLGGFTFGRPTRITCRVRPGTGKIVDIEREVELGGPLHSKGVLILSGFLAGRYALNGPMSLTASLVFEQSYSGVEGDSASSAELYALLSAIAELPLRQDLAVTGSVNQHGQIQAIAGVNEKIEGFFDICKTRGLTGSQGVLIPKTNVQHLMLRPDVVEACTAGRFSIFAIETIDQGIAMLSSKSTGERDDSGNYPEGTVNRLVEDRLRSFVAARRAALLQKFADAPEEG